MVSAQGNPTRIPPRKDDHFQRNLTIYRIDMDEKINQPMMMAENPGLYANTGYGEKNGLVAALINGLKSGKYLAYHPDSLNKSMTYDDMMAIYERQNGLGSEPEWEDEPIDDEIWIDEEEIDMETDEDPFFENGDALASGDEGMQLAPYESVVEFISNRIFDKNRSDIVQDIQYIRLVWVDPGETLPDQNFICLKYSDVLDVLEDTQWKNLKNDAEYRNMKEVFELQMFNKYVINVSGRGVRTLPESQFRTNQMTEFEHNLWSY